MSEGGNLSEVWRGKLDKASGKREERRELKKSKEFFDKMLEYLPKGGLGFHGSSDLFRESIKSKGLDPSPQWNIFYYGFDPKVDDQFIHSALRKRIVDTTLVGLNVSQGLRGGERKKGPLLVVFADRELQGTISPAHNRGSDPMPVKVIKKVPPQNILGLFTPGEKESREQFATRVICELSVRLQADLAK